MSLFHYALKVSYTCESAPVPLWIAEKHGTSMWEHSNFVLEISQIISKKFIRSIDTDSFNLILSASQDFDELKNT